MKCPHCGALMKDEQVFCESCGRERQLVPEFDAQMDETLQSTLSGIADDLANTKEIKPALVHTEIEKQKENMQLNIDSDVKTDGQSGMLLKKTGENTQQEIQIPQKEQSGPRINRTSFVVWVVGGIFAVAILIVGIAFGVVQYNNNSYEYQIQKAEEMSAAANYEQMLVYAKKALGLAPNSSDAKMMMARAYEGLKNRSSEKQMLIALLKADPAYAGAYDMLIPLMEEQQEYEQIGQLLMKCSQQSVLDKYVEYLIDAPEFSQDSGYYDDISAVSVKLLAVGTGIIYYTLNGLDPITNGREYMTPILLKQGTYEIRAVYRNIYGVYSEVVSHSYNVQASTVDKPVISLESGFYDSPQYISILNADELDTIYYTTDGSEPDTNGMLYTRPIPLPLGESHFIFAAYEEDLPVSEYAYADYTMQLDPGISDQQAVNILMQAQISAGALLGYDGTLPDMEGRKSYEVTSVISQDDILYYLLEEFYTPPSVQPQKTGNIFAVSTVTGESFMAEQNETGLFDLYKIQ